MKTNLNFNSAICTSRVQSKRLLALGLKKETADMCINLSHESELVYSFSYSEALSLYDNYGLGKIMETDLLLPAWSLHRLIELLPQWIDTTETSLKLTIDQGKLVCYRGIFDEVQTFIFGRTSLYDSIIDIIEKLIKGGYFNKEYLKE